MTGPATRRFRVTAALLAAFWTAAAAAAGPAPLPTESVYQLDARLHDASGAEVAWQSLRGRPRIATLFYATCRYVCPLLIESMRSVERRLSPAERARLGYVLITLNPVQDTPEVLGRLMAERRLDAAHWTLLQPDARDLRALAGLLDVRYRLRADGEFSHTAVLVLLDAEGRVLARSAEGGQLDDEFLAVVHAAAAH